MTNYSLNEGSANFVEDDEVRMARWRERFKEERK